MKYTRDLRLRKDGRYDGQQPLHPPTDDDTSSILNTHSQSPSPLPPNGTAIPYKMPPKKASADEAPSLILNYLIQQNRPYSAMDISSNLLNQVTKTKTDKILKELAEEGKIVGKNAGKAWIFHAVQVSFDVPCCLGLCFLLDRVRGPQSYDAKSGRE